LLTFGQGIKYESAWFTKPELPASIQTYCLGFFSTVLHGWAYCVACGCEDVFHIAGL